MGAYIYRTTTTKTATIVMRYTRGEQAGELIEVPVNVYEYAYKPYLRFDDTDNRRMEQRFVEPARRAFKRLGKAPAAWGITCHEGVITLGCPVWRTRGNVAVNDMGWGDYYPYVGTLVEVKRRGPGLTVDSMKEALDAGRDRIYKCSRGSPNGMLDCKYQAIREADDYVLRGWVNGVRGEHRLSASCTDNERLLAHWNGFVNG